MCKYPLAILIAVLSLFFLTAGCIQPENGVIEEPTPTPAPKEPETFRTGYHFIENEVLIHKSISAEKIDGGLERTQIIEVATVPLEVFEDHASLKSVMLKAVRIDENKQETNICDDLTERQKYSEMKLHSDGKVEYTDSSVTNLFIPQRELKIGEVWAFGTIKYELKQATSIEIPSGTFNVLEISYYGTRNLDYGQMQIDGKLFFDYENNRIAKYIQNETIYNYERRIETTLIAVKTGYEPEMECIYPTANLTPAEKYSIATEFNNKMRFKASLHYALSIKEDFEGKNLADLTTEGKETYINTMILLIDNYQSLEKFSKEMDARLAIAGTYSELFETGLLNKKANARYLLEAIHHFEAVAVSETAEAETAQPKLAELEERLIGIMEGKVILKDKGNNTGTTVGFFDGYSEIFSEQLGEPYFELPLLKSHEAKEFALYAFKNGYIPKIAVIESEDFLSKQYNLLLDPIEDLNKGFVFGSCYSETGFAENAVVSFQNSGEKKEIDCNKHYTLMLEEGYYSVSVNNKIIKEDIWIKAGETKIIHLTTNENN